MSPTKSNTKFIFFSEEVETLAKKNRLKFYRTSVKEDLNVNEGMLTICC